MTTRTHPSAHSRPLRVAVTALALSILAGCSSVKLDDNVPVTERTPTPVGGAGGAGGAAGAGSAPVDSRTVVPVQTPAADASQPPASVDRVIYFDFDSYTVKPEFMATLEAHARFLNADRQRRVVLEGHTDERGGREYNLALGQKRADAVRRALALLGVQDGQMESVSYGKEKPAVQGSGEEAWSRNRRVELVYR
ncbi:MAG: peptidoglycan-associated lipoprotein Pal [Tepidimonas taiwanensis]|uniref:peptidoglycan-associated lipoprotein Pal n=1 Tax=Tepidimonas taiwanensis TaxID=307486 RepID=UPI00068FE976|nr:peptidoglycan-associated lipoprotein Pal [Tepidimonas taiwanensis]MCX7693745.1 peptidoglycan-associated lipoprotein Pal [Tepidimonas taiwanensis]MDM7463686.1 peptidoglycan-associated lipoprotein Pal [Tepidimonas taiwanensis]